MLARMISALSSFFSCLEVIAFMVPWVPTGMNTGVSTVPCLSLMQPALAREVWHWDWTLKKVVGEGSPSVILDSKKIKLKIKYKFLRS